MASTRNVGVADLRGHQYVTGSAHPQMEKGCTMGRGMGTIQEMAEGAASAAEGILGGVMHTIRRRPVMTLLVGIAVGLAAVALLGSRTARERVGD